MNRQSATTSSFSFDPQKKRDDLRYYSLMKINNLTSTQWFHSEKQCHHQHLQDAEILLMLSDPQTSHPINKYHIQSTTALARISPTIFLLMRVCCVLVFLDLPPGPSTHWCKRSSHIHIQTKGIHSGCLALALHMPEPEPVSLLEAIVAAESLPSSWPFSSDSFVLSQPF
jgi:hypothetical protein